MDKIDVVKIYLALFSRPPEKEGLDNWYNQAIENNWDMSELAEHMFDAAVSVVNSSDDYKEIYPQYADFDINSGDKVREVVESIYKILFNKTYDDDQQGIDGWVENIKSTHNVGNVVNSLINAADEYASMENAGELKDDNIVKSVLSYEYKLTIAQKFSQFIDKADVNNDGIYDLKVFKDIIDHVNYEAQNVIDASKAIDSLAGIEKYFDTHTDKIDYVNSDEFFEYNNHKLPLIIIDSNYGNFKAIVDDEGDILPLLYIGDKVDIVGEIHIENQTNTNDLNDNSLIVDLVDVGF